MSPALTPFETLRFQGLLLHGRVLARDHLQLVPDRISRAASARARAGIRILESWLRRLLILMALALEPGLKPRSGEHVLTRDGREKPPKTTKTLIFRFSATRRRPISPRFRIPGACERNAPPAGSPQGACFSVSQRSRPFSTIPNPAPAGSPGASRATGRASCLPLRAARFPPAGAPSPQRSTPPWALRSRRPAARLPRRSDRGPAPGQGSGASETETPRNPRIPGTLVQVHTA